MNISSAEVLLREAEEADSRFTDKSMAVYQVSTFAPTLSIAAWICASAHTDLDQSQATRRKKHIQ